MLLALRDSRRPIRPATLRLWGALIREVITAPNGLEALGSVFRYVADTRDGDIIDALVLSANAHEVEELAMTWKQQLIAEGREEGREEGRREALRLLIRLKFGAVGPSVEARLVGATLPELDTWTARMLAASSLDEVFEAR